MGSGVAHNLGQNGSMQLVQLQPNQVLDGMMARKETQMVQLGAKLIENQGNVTAEATRINASSETANLSSLVDNVGKAMTDALRACAEYLGLDPMDAVLGYEINQDFFPSMFDPQATIAMIQAYDRNLIGAKEVLDQMRKAGVIERTDEEIADEADARGF
jgi:hypothetical protein